jgi:hypothetical protein
MSNTPSDDSDRRAATREESFAEMASFLTRQSKGFAHGMHTHPKISRSMCPRREAGMLFFEVDRRVHRTGIK